MEVKVGDMGGIRGDLESPPRFSGREKIFSGREKRRQFVRFQDFQHIYNIQLTRGKSFIL